MEAVLIAIGIAALVSLSIAAVWLVDRHRVHVTAICLACRQLRRVDRGGRCHHCFENDGGWC